MEKEEMQEGKIMNERGILNRDVIKYIAIVTMLLNHIAHTLLSDPYSTTAIVFEDIGYFTAPIMCYFLVEGFHYTRSKRKYGMRLFAFSMISIVPYYLAFGAEQMNMIWTLFLCFLILYVVHRQDLRPESRGLYVAALFILTIWSDWGIFAPLMVLLFYRTYGNRKRTMLSFVISALLYGAECTHNYYTWALYLYDMTGWSARLWGLAQGIFAALPVLIAGLVICFLYNGKKMQVQSAAGRAFNRWFFYVFYPVHLTVLAILMRCVV